MVAGKYKKKIKIQQVGIQYWSDLRGNIYNFLETFLALKNFLLKPNHH